MTAFFVSDLHFGLLSKIEEKEREIKFVKFLEYIAKDATQLFIVGDLFDYWFEYERVIQKGYFRTFTALQNLTDAGIKVHYIIGNHDFMHRDFFDKELGVKVYENPIKITLEGKKFFIAHGDGLVKKDFGYKILKKILRNKTAQKFYSLIHPDLGIWLASSTSRKSRNYTSEKNYGETDGMFLTAEKLLAKGFDFVVFGHSHKKKEIEINDGKYINLGTWLTKPYYGKFINGKFDVMEWNNK